MPAAVLSEPNSKLGPLVHGWSIPAEETCPGASALCRSRCYATRGFFRMPNVQRTHARNYLFSLTGGFADWAAAAIRAEAVQVMRIHVSGDFYDTSYIRKWIDIVRHCRNQRFFAYTRSWRMDEMLPELVRLSRLPNMTLWWSLDRETGPAPLIRGVRRAYMAIDDVDAENAPDDCDLVFRDQPDTVMKKANGIQVCPTENGVATQIKITCTRCGICWRSNLPKWETSLRPYLAAQPADGLREVNVPERMTCRTGANLTG